MSFWGSARDAYATNLAVTMRRLEEDRIRKEEAKQRDEEWRLTVEERKRQEKVAADAEREQYDRSNPVIGHRVSGQFVPTDVPGSAWAQATGAPVRLEDEAQMLHIRAAQQAEELGLPPTGYYRLPAGKTYDGGLASLFSVDSPNGALLPSQLVDQDAAAKSALKLAQARASGESRGGGGGGGGIVTPWNILPDDQKVAWELESRPLIGEDGNQVEINGEKQRYIVMDKESHRMMFGSTRAKPLDLADQVALSNYIRESTPGDLFLLYGQNRKFMGGVETRAVEYIEEGRKGGINVPMSEAIAYAFDVTPPDDAAALVGGLTYNPAKRTVTANKDDMSIDDFRHLVRRVKTRDEDGNEDTVSVTVPEVILRRAVESLDKEYWPLFYPDMVQVPEDDDGAVSIWADPVKALDAELQQKRK